MATLPAAISVNGTALEVWPRGQITSGVARAQIAMTKFADAADYHPALIDATLAAEQDPRFRDPKHKVIPAGCGNKVRNLQDWNVPAANLIHARALMMAQHSTSWPSVFPDDTWASVYRTGDYCMPHGHPRSEVSIVYMLDPGDSDPTDTIAGQLSFIVSVRGTHLDGRQMGGDDRGMDATGTCPRLRSWTQQHDRSLGMRTAAGISAIR